MERPIIRRLFPIFFWLTAIFTLLLLTSAAGQVAADDARPGSKKAEKVARDQSESASCGEFVVKWSNVFDYSATPGMSTLVIETKEGEQLLSVAEKAWAPSTIQFLWCEDLLRDDNPAVAYTVYTGGAHCCWLADVVIPGRPLRWLLRKTMIFVDLLPKQLDGAGPLELVTRTNVLAMMGNLPSFATPFLPLVFAYDGKEYKEDTRRFPEHIRADLREALTNLAGDSFNERAGKALRAFGDYVLLGQPDKGLAELKGKVSEDVAAWLDKHAAEAIERINKQYAELPPTPQQKSQ